MEKSYTIYGPENKWEEHYLNYLFKYLHSKNYQAVIQKRSLFILDITQGHPNWYGQVLRKNIIVQNDSTKQFFAINHADQPYDISWELLDHPLYIGTLKCQYRNGHYEGHERKIAPFTYGVKEPENYFPIREQLRGAKRENRLLYFKGNETGRRDVLRQLADMGIINPNFGIRDEKGGRTQKASQQEYLKCMAKSKLILSMPGIGAHCHRELEAFGLQVPVLMPRLLNQYYDNLIPDFHYITVESPPKEPKKFTKEEEKAFCDAIKAKYEEVIDNDDYLESISKNALIWFQQNIEYPNNMRLLERILSKMFNYQLC